MEHFTEYVNLATTVVAAASIVANFTKTASDNAVVAVLSKIVHIFAINWSGEAAPKS